jgi:uncharacterized protein with PIN domain
MSRIRSAYELKLRDLLRSIGARKPDKALRHFTACAEDSRRRQAIPLSNALGEIYLHTRNRIQRVRPAALPSTEPVRFLCDAGLGGLARWLRAAGYEALWYPDIHDHELIHKAQRDSLIIVTTDSLLMERRLIRSGEVKAVWIPPARRAPQQLGLVLGELRLPVLDSRCMDCGGTLQRVDKEAARNEIPPRTYRWLNEFWKCAACGKLFWHGTHYQRIRQHLQTLSN